MSGQKSGVKTQILKEENRALYIHCFNHALNLGVNDTMKSIQLLKDTLSFSEEIIILIKKSRKRETMLKNLKLADSEAGPGVKTFCRTRWTVKGASLDSLITNYKALLKLFKISYREETKTDMKSRINGCRSKMLQFEFFLGICLARDILNLTDRLAEKLQRKDLCVSEAKELYKMTAEILEGMKSNEFDKFWENTVQKSQDLNIEMPQMKRNRKRPARLIEIDSSSDEEIHDLPTTPKEYFKKIFLQSIDEVVKCLKERFEQDGLKIYENLQQLLLLAVKGDNYDEKMDIILDFYKDDFNSNSLKTEMKIFKTMFPKKDDLKFGDLISFFKENARKVRYCIPEVCKVMELILVLPASNASPERSFSKLRSIKTHLRSTMSAERLNHFMILGHYTKMVDNLDSEKIATEFISRYEVPEKTFGKVSLE